MASQTDQNDSHELIKPITVSLTVDRFDRIIAVSDNWDEVAQQGKAKTSIQNNQVLGKEFNSFIRDERTRMYFDASLKLCRVRNETLFRTYRCDSPTHKRFMELELVPLPNKSVAMNHYLLKEEPFANLIEIEDVEDKQNPFHAGIFQYVRCSLCNALKPVGSHEWLEPATMVTEHAQQFKVIHSVCPDCKAKVWRARR